MKDVHVGFNLMIDIYGCNYVQIENIDFILHTMDHIVDMLGAKTISKTYHKFTPQGISAAYIISESHVTIHTWPENGYVGLDIFTCTNDFEVNKIINYIKEEVRPKKLKYCGLFRGKDLDL